MTKILVIEDEPKVRANIEEILQLADFDTIVAKDGLEGLQLARENLPDLIICDIMMPELDGYGVISGLKEEEKMANIPFVFLSAKSDRSDFRQGMNLGADDYLTKPFTPEELLGAIAARLERAAQQQAKLEEVAGQLKKLENFDALTGLPNKSTLGGKDGYLSLAISKRDRVNRLIPLLLLGLDRFTRINEALGYSQGDLVLQKSAQRLQKWAILHDENVYLVRVEGDKFAIILPPISQESSALKIANKLLDVVGKPIDLERQAIPITASIGIAFYPNVINFEELLRQAATALKEAKNEGGNFCKIYRAQLLGNKVDSNLTLAADLHRAWEQKMLEVAYHPRLNARNRKTIGIAATVKWEHPIQGAIPPAKTFSIAEESGLTVSLAEWILETAIIQVKNWLAAGVNWQIAVSLPPAIFNAPNIESKLIAMLRKAEVEPKYLEVEVAANTISSASNLNQAATKLLNFKKLGMTTTISEFKLEHSSWGYLSELAADKIKIDRELIVNFHQNSPILSTLVKIASRFKLKIVADGVKTEALMKALSKQKFDEVQHDSLFMVSQINQVKSGLNGRF